MLTLIQLYRQDIGAALSSASDRRKTRLIWARAVVETLDERALSSDQFPVRPLRKDRVERFLPFWRSLDDDELFALRDVLRAYFSRAENRDLSLDDDTDDD